MTRMTCKKTVIRQTLILLPVFVNVTLMGASAGWVANALYLLKCPQSAIPITFFQASGIAAMEQIGKLVFAVPCGLLADKSGRKKLCTYIAITHLICWLMLSASKSITMIYVARFCIGIATAMLHSVSVIMIGEIASPEFREMYVGIYETCSNIGKLLQSIISVAFSSYNMLNYANLFFSAFYFATVWNLKETPSHLINTCREEKAIEILKYIRPSYTDEELNTEYKNMKNAIESEKHLKDNNSFVNFLISPVNRRCLLVTIGLNFFVNFTGAAPISSYITLILPRTKYVPKKFYPLIMDVAKLLAMIGATFVLNKLPRKTYYILLTIVVCLVQIGNGVLKYIEHYGIVYDALFIFGNLLFLLIWTTFMEPINDLVRSELFPQNVKGIGSSLYIMSAAAAKALSYALFEKIRTTSGLYANYWTFAINSVITGVIVYFGLPEGRGRSLADIQNALQQEFEL